MLTFGPSKGVVMKGPIAAAAKHDAVLIGEHFSAWRRLRGLKLIEVSKLSGFSMNTLRDLESGKGGTGLMAVLGIENLRPEALDPYNSDIGRARAAEELPRRIR